MSPGLQQKETQQREMVSADSKHLGPIGSNDYQKINACGWDVYNVTYENGTSITEAAPAATLRHGSLPAPLYRVVTEGAAQL